MRDIFKSNYRREPDHGQRISTFTVVKGWKIFRQGRRSQFKFKYNEERIIMKNIKSIGATAVLALVIIGVSGCSTSNWQSRVDTVLPEYGHRNWVVVADSAYPLQTAAGIETIYAGGDHIEVLEKVLESISRQKHVRPVIFTDAELKYVDEKNAPGIGGLREQLQSALASRTAQVLPHEDIIAQLDEAGETFRVMIIKTDLTLPYTSVFIRLDCGYWSAEAEEALRAAMP